MTLRAEQHETFTCSLFLPPFLPPFLPFFSPLVDAGGSRSPCAGCAGRKLWRRLAGFRPMQWVAGLVLLGWLVVVQVQAAALRAGYLLGAGGGDGLVEFSGCDLLAGLGACSCWAGAVCFVQSSTKSNTILCATFHH